jgi:hypothetical protein
MKYRVSECQVWLPYCSWKDISLHAWENELLPLGLTFWELFSLGFWQFYPHSSARQVGWISLKHCQWSMRGLCFGDFAFFILAYNFFHQRGKTNHGEHEDKNPLYLIWHQIDHQYPARSKTGRLWERELGVCRSLSLPPGSQDLLEEIVKTTYVSPLQIKAL